MCSKSVVILSYPTVYIIIKIKIHSSCEIEYFVETHCCKLCVILRSRVLRVVCPHQGFFFLSHFYFPASGQAMVTSVIPSPPRFLPSIFIAHRVQQSHCSSIVHRVLITHALAFRKSICPQEQIPTNLHEYAPGRARTHEIDLYQARAQPDTPQGRPVQYGVYFPLTRNTLRK